MPNLVGIGLSQVPTNSMLGGLAYQDPEHASIKDLDLRNLSQINSEIADTATDIFVYDTRKDSDGGAWRKRTQHTSWYNETLGTATRGTRREFPAVAVLVLEAGKLTIYDGDDPDLPMWMVFNNTGSSVGIFGRSLSTKTSVEMLNGLLVIGGSYSSAHFEAFTHINFISEKCQQTDNTGTVVFHKNISQRGETSTYTQDTSSFTLLNIVSVNDVAMTVLPNALIDDATGLPVPTIAVAVGKAGSANGGVSVIKDDGSVVDIIAGTGAGGYASYNVEFGSNNELIHTQAYNNSYASVNIFDDIPSSDISASNSYSAARSYLYINGVPDIRGGVNGASTPNLEYVSKSSNGDIAFGFQNTDAKLSLLSEPEGAGTDNQYSSVAYIASDYNTGWMHGHIKGAFLSDTDTTNATYTSVADDWATTSAWTKQSSISVSSTGSGTSGTLSITGNGTGSNVYFFNGISVEANTDYVVSVTFGAENANEFYINDTTYSTANKLIDINALSGSTRGGHFNTGSNTFLYIQGYQVSTTATTITNLVVQKVSEKDRSRNKKGLQVFGTITKQPVATGAELVAYGPFSSANYLKQPYNSDLQWDGNATWSISFWVYFTQNQAYDTLISREQPGGSGNRWSLQTGNQNTITFKSQGSSRVQVPGDSVHSQWRHICFTQEGGLYRAYRDGVEVGTYVGSDNFSNTSAELNIGYETSVGGADHSKLALVRISNSFPSPEQIKKMYNDEKHLFQENAKATLYGSSNAVTGLAHDDSTDSLHVGTSAGRSEFQGLCRINNTTEAVTTAISASNELVAEQ